jgi:hypothetical protein
MVLQLSNTRGRRNNLDGACRRGFTQAVARTEIGSARTEPAYGLAAAGFAAVVAPTGFLGAGALG